MSAMNQSNALSTSPAQSQPVTRTSQAHFTSMYSEGEPHWVYVRGTENWRHQVTNTTANKFVRMNPTFLRAPDQVVGNLDPSSPTICYAYHTDMPFMRWAMNLNTTAVRPRVCEVQLQFVNYARHVALWKTKAGYQIKRMPLPEADPDTFRGFFSHPFADAVTKYSGPAKGLLTAHQLAFVETGRTPDPVEFYRTWSRGFEVHPAESSEPKAALTAIALDLPSASASTNAACTATDEPMFRLGTSATMPAGSSLAMFPDACFGIAIPSGSAEASPDLRPMALDCSSIPAWNVFDSAWDVHVATSASADQMMQWQAMGFQDPLQPTASPTDLGAPAQLVPQVESLLEEEGEDFAAEDRVVDTTSESVMGPMSDSPVESVIVCASTILEDGTRGSDMWDASHLA